MKRFSRIRRVATTGSTNEDMARILGENDGRGLTIVTDYQTRGSGRKGRSWIAPPGSSLLFTTSLPETIPSKRLWLVPFWIGLVVHSALKSLEIETRLQWPNDILLREKKVGGILCISRVVAERAWAACGVGINVHRPRKDRTIETIEPPPAFLSDDRDIEREELLEAVLYEADRLWTQLDFPAEIVRNWEAAASIPGACYRLQLDGRDDHFEARAVALAINGGLIVEEGGRRRTVSLADARVLR